jgi:hypothetical protein
VENFYIKFHEHPADCLIADNRPQMGFAHKRFFFNSWHLMRVRNLLGPI